MGYRIGYSGPKVDELLQKALNTSIINNGWAKYPSSAKNPCDLDTLTEQGCYSVSYWENSPDDLTTEGPLNIIISKDSSGIIYQTILDNGNIYTRASNSDGTFSADNEWESVQSDTTIGGSDAFGDNTIPSNPEDNYIWIDSNEVPPVIKIFNKTNNSWMSITPENMAKESIYDPQGIKRDFNEYIDEKIDEADLENAVDNYEKHLTDTVLDGITWVENAISDTKRFWYSVCYGNGKYVAVGDDTNYYAYSTDGINWIENTISDTSRNWYSVCYGNGKYVAVSNSNYSAYSTDGITWIENTISSTSRYCRSVCYGNGKYVAVGNSTYSAYSTDGITWIENTIGDTSRQWRSVCYGNGKYVAIAYSSTYSAYSTDGITWIENTISSTSKNWESVCYGNGKYVAVDGNGYSAYSTDGINWIVNLVTYNRSLTGISYGNGKYVAVASGNYCYYSTDGIDWIENKISSTSRWLQSVCYGNGKYVAVDGNGYSAYGIFSEVAIHVTPEEKSQWLDSVSQSTLNSKVNDFSNEMTTLATSKVNERTSYINNTLDTDINTIKTEINDHINDSSIHITQEQATSFDNKAEGNHTHLNDGTVTVSTSNITGLIPIERIDPSVIERCYYVNSIEEMNSLTKNEVQNGDTVYVNSTTPSTWFVVDDEALEGVKFKESTISDTSREWQSVCYGNGKFVAVAYNDNYSAYSTDGITWIENTISDTSRYWYSVCYGNGKYVAVAYDSTYSAYSTDGINWIENTISDTSRYWQSVCYGNGKYVAIANYSTYSAYSTDGINWIENKISDTSRYWRSVCYGNGKYVAIANYSTYSAYSTDGINWIENTISDTSRYWRSVCYGNGKYVAIAYESTYSAYSTDGINWIENKISDTSRYWWSVCYGNGKYVAIAWYDTYSAYSTDGINWIENTISDTSRDWWSVCYGNGKYVAIAYDSKYSAYSLSPFIQYSASIPGFSYNNIENKPEDISSIDNNYYSNEEITNLYNTIKASYDNSQSRVDSMYEVINTTPENLNPDTIYSNYITNINRAIALNKKLDYLILDMGLTKEHSSSLINAYKNRTIDYENPITIDKEITYSFTTSDGGTIENPPILTNDSVSFNILESMIYGKIVSVNKDFESEDYLVRDSVEKDGYYEFSGWSNSDTTNPVTEYNDEEVGDYLIPMTDNGTTEIS